MRTLVEQGALKGHAGQVNVGGVGLTCASLLICLLVVGDTGAGQG